MADEVRENPGAQRYELAAGDGLVVVEYRRRGDVLHIVHTGTPPALRGRGLAGRLVKAMLADVRARGLRIVPHCSFVADYLDRHPEERDLVAES